VSTTSAVITGLTNGTTYYVWVRPKNAKGVGSTNIGISGIPFGSIVCLGDSITAGYIKGSDYPDKSYPAHLQKRVTVKVVNAGVSGDTTTKALSRVNGDVLSKSPQIVIIALGGNDLRTITLSNFQTVLNTMRDNLQSIINNVKGSNRKLYLVNYLSKEMISGVARSLDNAAIDNQFTITLFYNYISGIYTSLAESNNIELIEDLITAEIYKSYMSDTVHPNERGYEMLSEIIFNKLKPFLVDHNLVK
jgi:lysophospholipase L1-like esterase